MDAATLYRQHVETLSRRTDAACAATGFDGVVFHAGRARVYHGDDLGIPFRATPHFRRWAPVPGPDHWLVAPAGGAPTLVRVVPRDFWVEAPLPPDHPFAELLEVRDVDDAEAARLVVGDVSGFAYVGPDADEAARAGIPPDAVEPAVLLARLDWDCATKTAYEVHCLRAAASRAAPGHAAARQLAEEGRSEREIHAAYLAATGHLDAETPYPNIIAWDDHAAVLHYSAKRATPPDRGAVLLIDAGAEHWGYGSDITRTHPFAHASDEFRALVDAMDALQRRCVDAVAPGRPYLDVHVLAIQGVAEILCQAGILRGDPVELVAAGAIAPFLPHGVGHQLGVQVHDVGGIQAAPEGGTRPPPPGYAALRNTRTLEPGHVVTVEPGLYFIPMLLDPFRSGHALGDHFDWPRIDALLPFGGIRIEDDVLVTSDAREDLTRPLVSGHREAA